MVIARYAPLYYPGYWIEINNGQQFVLTITYQEENVQDKGKNVQGEMSKDAPAMARDSS